MKSQRIFFDSTKSRTPKIEKAFCRMNQLYDN